MFLLNLVTQWLFVTATMTGTAGPLLEPENVPSIIVAAANNEVRDGRIVAVYLDREITTSQVYRVIMDASEWDRRLTIRSDGVVLIKQRLYEPATQRFSQR